MVKAERTSVVNAVRYRVMQKAKCEINQAPTLGELLRSR